MTEGLNSPGAKEALEEEYFNRLLEISKEKLASFYDIADLTDRELMLLRQEVREAMKSSNDYEEYLKSIDGYPGIPLDIAGQAPVPYSEAVYAWLEHYLGLDVVKAMPMRSSMDENSLRDFNNYLQIVLQRRRQEGETSGVDGD